MKIIIKHSIIYFFLTIVFLSCKSPKALEYISYQNFKINQLNFTTSAVNMDLKYYNPNNFGLQLKNTELDIFINNSFLGHSSSDSLIRIPRRDTFLFPLKFDVDMRNLFKNVVTTFSKDEVLIKVTGRLKVGKANVFMSMPVNYEGKQKFSLF